MTALPPRRPWRGERTWAAVVLPVGPPATYLLAAGPLLYAALVGWIPNVVFLDVYSPLRRAIDETPAGDAFWEHLHWWITLAEQDPRL